MRKKIPVEISARHIHLSQKDLESLFGRGYKLKKIKNLTQPSDFAAKETLGIEKGKKKFSKVRIVGPCREETQVEISITDAVFLGINPSIRKSGNLKGTPAISLLGPKKRIKIKKGVVVPARHIHISPEEAKAFRVRNEMKVSVRIKGDRGLVFDNVRVRVDRNYKLSMHIDTDEGNAAGIIKKGEGYLVL